MTGARSVCSMADEFARESLAIRVNRRFNSIRFIDVLSGLFILLGVPEHIRSDNVPEFVAKAVESWICATTSWLQLQLPMSNRDYGAGGRLINRA